MTLAMLVLGAFMLQPTVEETVIDFDVRNADVLDVLRLMSEVGGFNLIADPDVKCELTLKVSRVPWPQVMELVLKTCRLGEDRIGANIVRVARVDQLLTESQERRKLDEERQLSGPLRTTYRRLAYGKAKDMAPILKKFLSPRGDVTFDERTNTLIITDIEPPN